MLAIVCRPIHAQQGIQLRTLVKLPRWTTSWLSRRCGQQRVRYARDFRNNMDQLSNVSLYSYSNYIFHKLPASQARRGGLASTPPDDMLATLFKATFAQTGVDPKDVGDVVIGSVLGPSSQRANECRIAMFLAGMPETVPVHTVNRCVFMLDCFTGIIEVVLIVRYISRDSPARHGMWSVPQAQVGAGNARQDYKPSLA